MERAKLVTRHKRQMLKVLLTRDGEMKFAPVILMLTFLLSGCGSIISRVAGERYTYYHGTQFDAESVNFDKPLSLTLLLDLPFSLVADTLLFPVDLIYSPYCGMLVAHDPAYPKP